MQDPQETPLAGVKITFLGLDGNGNTTSCSGSGVSDAGGNFSIGGLAAPAWVAADPLRRLDGHEPRGYLRRGGSAVHVRRGAGLHHAPRC